MFYFEVYSGAIILVKRIDNRFDTPGQKCDSINCLHGLLLSLFPTRRRDYSPKKYRQVKQCLAGQNSVISFGYQFTMTMG